MNKFATLILILCSTTLLGQRNWKTQKSKDGSVIVKSEIESTDNGKVIHYIAETTANISLQKAEEYLKNSNTHKNFLENTTESKEIQKKSENNWITYYFFDAPWPMPNSDAVQEFKLSKTENSLLVKGISNPKAYKTTDVKRMEQYDISYSFIKVGENRTKLTVATAFTPVSKVPNFLLKGWFPKGPANIVSRLVNEISKK